VDKNSLGLGTQGFSLGQVPDEDKAWGEMLHEMAEGNGYSRLLAYITAFFESGFLNLMECFHLTTPTHGDANANVSTWLLLAPGTQCK
jgi:hypothetical protein